MAIYLNLSSVFWGQRGTGDRQKKAVRLNFRQYKQFCVFVYSPVGSDINKK